jgi:hypothetical protein
LLHDALRLLGIVPEIRARDLFFEVFQYLFLAGDVKDNSARGPCAGGAAEMNVPNLRESSSPSSVR